MKRINVIIQSLTTENKYSFYLSFFRVFISLLLIKKLLLQWSLIPLLYSGQSYLAPTNSIITEFFISFDSNIIRTNIYIFLGLYLLLLILFLFGFGKNITAIILFLFYDILQKLCPQILNGGDNYMRFILLYFAFANSFDFFSFVNQKIKRFSTTKIFLSNLAGLSICLHLCLIYFISAIHKIHADVWFNGVATYYTFNIERFNGTFLNNSLSKNALFVSLTTYATWFIELLYPFLIWFKQTQKIMITLAIILHIGIAIFMMLYDFQFIFILVQGFFISNTNWVKLYNTFMLKIYPNKPPSTVSNSNAYL
jgi:hypothetical protein